MKADNDRSQQLIPFSISANDLDYIRCLLRGRIRKIESKHNPKYASVNKFKIERIKWIIRQINNSLIAVTGTDDFEELKELGYVKVNRDDERVLG